MGVSKTVVVKFEPMTTHPMFNIPETFNKAVSYEGQIHILYNAILALSDEMESLKNRIEVLENE